MLHFLTIQATTAAGRQVEDVFPIWPTPGARRWTEIKAELETLGCVVTQCTLGIGDSLPAAHIPQPGFCEDTAFKCAEEAHSRS